MAKGFAEMLRKIYKRRKRAGNRRYLPLFAENSPDAQGNVKGLTTSEAVLPSGHWRWIVGKIVPDLQSGVVGLGFP